jgi:hypothetical protein
MLPHRSIEANSYARDGTVEKESLTSYNAVRQKYLTNAGNLHRRVGWGGPGTVQKFLKN